MLEKHVGVVSKIALVQDGKTIIHIRPWKLNNSPGGTCDTEIKCQSKALEGVIVGSYLALDVLSRVVYEAAQVHILTEATAEELGLTEEGPTPARA